jgi:hypothetical protein
LASRFVSVIEPFKDQPLIESTRPIELKDGGAAAAIEAVRSDGGTDIVVYGDPGTEKALRDGRLATDAHVAVVRRDEAGKIIGRFFAGGSFLQTGGDRLVATGFTGKVVSVDPGKSQIHVQPDQSDAKSEDFVGRVIHFRNDLRQTAHPIVAAERRDEHIVLTTGDDLLVGRARVDDVREAELITKTAMPLAATYRGVTLADAAFVPLTLVKQVERGRIELASRPDSPPRAGADVWLLNVGPSDTFELPALVEDVRQP